MIRSIVAGGAGFLGSHLCDRLLTEGHEVICIDNLVTGSTANIAHNLENTRFSFVEYDVTNRLFVEGPIDYIYNLASPASPIDYLKLPIETLKVGSYGTHRTLELAKEKGAKYLISSTSETYGDPLIHPQVETYWGNVNPIGPRSVYDEAKRYAEAAVMAYYRYEHLDTKIARIFNTYGERMRVEDGRAIPAFMSQAIRGEDVTVFGNGSQTRSVCYVTDLVDGLFRLMNSDYHLPVNIGNPDEVTMLQLAEECIEIANSKSKIVFRELPEDDPKVRKPDITLAKKLLNWEPKVPRRTGLLKTYKYFEYAVRNR